MRLQLCVLLLVAAAAPAMAGVIYDHDGFDGGLIGPYSDYDQGYAVADDFILQDGASTIRDIHWWGGYDPEQFGPDDFDIFILDDDGGLPDATVAIATGTISRSNTGFTDPGGFDIWQYDMSLDAEIQLLPNTTYWLAIINQTDSWFWQPSSRFGTHAQSDGEDITLQDYDLAFYLTDDPIVPEPASMALLGLGLAGLAARRRYSAN